MLNDLGVDPNEWFDNPLDRMPIATNKPLHSDNKEKVNLPAEFMEVPTSVTNPKPEPKPKKKEVKEDDNIHQKMYEIATAKYNPFAVGGSENIHDFDSVGGSEEAHK